MNDSDVRMDPEAYVLEVLTRITGLRPEQINMEARLVQDLHLDGDDATDALLDISKVFPMDFSAFDATKHFRSEPSLLTLLWFLPSQKRERAAKLPLTVKQLIDAARLGHLRS